MTAISVCGAYGQLHNLDFSSPNLQQARRIAGEINSRVESRYFPPLKDDIGSVPGSDQGHLRAQDGLVRLPAFYPKSVMDTANATIGRAAAQNQSVLGGASNVPIAENALGQSNKNIAATTGNNNLAALGRGSDTISAGNGDDPIRLGSGRTGVLTAGKATATGGSGNANISGDTGLRFVSGAGDVMDNRAQRGGSPFRAGPGNETLTGGAWAGSQHASDAFIFLKGETARSEMTNNFMPSRDHADLKGYAQNDLSSALASAHITPQGMTFTGSDQTTITFTDLSLVDPKSFILR
jgi:hypothetical protein